MNEFKSKEEKLNSLTEIAIQELKKGQSIDPSCHFIQLNVDPTFTKKFVLQFELFNTKVNWYKTIWEMDVDRTRIYSEPIENEISRPTLLFENGTYELIKFEPILKMIKSISLPIYTDDWHTLRDGDIYTLTMGYRGSISNYTWHYLPEEWNELQKITDLILNLYKN